MNQASAPAYQEPRPFAASLLIAGALALLYLAVRPYNIEIFRFINRDGGPALDLLMDGSTQICAGYANFFLFLFLLVWRPRLGLRGLKALLLVLVAVRIGKMMFNDPRPLAVLDGVRVLGPALKRGSFPSGHTTEMMAVAVVLHQYLGARGLPVYFLALLGGLSRIYVGAHFPVDVAAGACLGALIGMAASADRGWEDRAASWIDRNRLVLSRSVPVLAIAVSIQMRFASKAAQYSPVFYSLVLVLVLLASGRLLKDGIRKAETG